MEENREEVQLDLSILWIALKKFWYFVVIAAVLVGIAAGVYTQWTVKNTYTCTSRYIVNPAVQGGSSSSSLIYVAQSYAKEFTGVVAQPKTISDALITYGQKNFLDYYDPETGGNNLVRSVLSCVSCKVVEQEGQIFDVKVTASTPDRAYNIALTLEDFLPDYLSSVISEDAVRVATINGAEYPRSADGIPTMRNAVLGAAVAAVLTYGGFLVYQFLNNELSDEKSLVQMFKNVPVLGRIPNWGDPNRRQYKQEKKQGFANNVRNYNGKLLSSETPFAIIESFKTLRSNVSYVLGADGCAVLAGTSIRKASGKTVVLSNLAVSYAQLGKKVLLIEADMRIPSFHKIFGMKRGNGLSEILAGIVPNYRSCLSKTAIPGLDIILSGQIPPNPSELLSTKRMKDLLDEAKKLYDIILIDLPPFSGLTDAAVLSPWVDGYIMITRIGHTSLSEIKYGLNDMKQVGMKVVGFVVNDVSMKSGRYSYYRYGYKRSYSYDYAASTADAASGITSGADFTISPEESAPAPEVQSEAQPEAPKRRPYTRRKKVSDETGSSSDTTKADSEN